MAFNIFNRYTAGARIAVAAFLNATKHAAAPSRNVDYAGGRDYTPPSWYGLHKPNPTRWPGNPSYHMPHQGAEERRRRRQQMRTGEYSGVL